VLLCRIAANERIEGRPFWRALRFTLTTSVP
jgi:hypothetical protein